MIIFNKYTNECYETKYTNPKCAEINEDLASCFKCRDPKADPAKNCSCADGAYLDLTTNTCKSIYLLLTDNMELCLLNLDFDFS